MCFLHAITIDSNSEYKFFSAGTGLNLYKPTWQFVTEGSQKAHGKIKKGLLTRHPISGSKRLQGN